MSRPLQRGRRRLDELLTRTGRTHTFSLPSFLLVRAVERALAEHARGDCLDAGSGRSPFRRRLERRGCRVTALDVEDRGGADLIADVQRMPQVPAGRFATVLCTQVLEHVPRPWRAIGELARVLEPGGHLIVSVPHLSAVHEAPDDYFRFTRYGLRSLLEDAGCEVLSLDEVGGIVAFLAHPLSYGLMSLGGGLPGVGPVVRWLNYLLLVRMLAPVDRLVGMQRIYPSNLLAVARRPSASR